MMKNFDSWMFVAGIALFIFSMNWIEESLKNIAGRGFKKYLQRQTSKPVRAIFGGTVVTAFLQSSSVVLLMVLSFVGAGIISMRNALAVVMGSNLGTTLDSWVVALLGFKMEISRFSYPLLGLALVLWLLFGSRKKMFWFSRFLTGFALLFIGLEWMKDSVSGMIGQMDVSGLSSYSAYLAIPVGFIITAIIQSSSATIAITLTALYSGILPLDHAAAIVIGSELGTSVKILLGAIGSTADKIRVAWGNFLFNAVTLVIGAILLYPLLQFLEYILPISDPLILLVVFQSSLNLLNIILFFPFLRHFADFLEKRFSKGENHRLTRYIHSVPRTFSEDVLREAGKETVHLMTSALRLNRLAFGIEEKSRQEDGWYTRIRNIATAEPDYATQYRELKLLQGEILEFLVDIREAEITKAQLRTTGQLLSVCREVIHGVKNIKDIFHNLEELKETANDELFSAWESLRVKVDGIYSRLVELIHHPEQHLVSEQLEALQEENKVVHEASINQALRLLQSGKILELEASSLLNVYQEVYSSNKALIGSAEDLLEPGDENLSVGTPSVL